MADGTPRLIVFPRERVELGLILRLGRDPLGALAVGRGARRACRTGGLEPDRNRLVLVGAADEAAAGALGQREARLRVPGARPRTVPQPVPSPLAGEGQGGGAL